jgi:hypothetical protein
LHRPGVHLSLFIHWWNSLFSRILEFYISQNPQFFNMAFTALIVLAPLFSGQAFARPDATMSSGFAFNSGFFKGEIPSTVQVPAACSSAYATSIDCDQSLFVPFNGTAPQSKEDAVAAIKSAFSSTYLDSICTQTCADSLLSYQKAVQTGCASLPQDVVTKMATPLIQAAMLGQLSLKMYWQKCKKDL